MNAKSTGLNSVTTVSCITAPNPGPFTYLGTNSYVVGDETVIARAERVGPAVLHVEELSAHRVPEG